MLRTCANWLVAAVATALLGACAADMPYRAPELTAEQLQSCGRSCTGRPVETLHYKLPDGSNVDYLMGYVEFDDQGWFHSPAQRQRLFDTLRRHHDDRGDQFLIVAYAHGWKHNAAVDDDDVGHFSACSNAWCWSRPWRPGTAARARWSASISAGAAPRCPCRWWRT